jgi:hypothetical protein
MMNVTVHDELSFAYRFFIMPVRLLMAAGLIKV